MRTFQSLKSWLAATALVVGLSAPAAAENPAGVAITEVKEGVGPKNAVQNRFFLKQGRVEVAPVLGYVPNDPLVQRFVGGIIGAYHFSEEFAAEGAFMYAPDLGQSDLKGLVTTLVQIAADDNGGNTENFRQPLDKMVMGASFAARWAPFYGKINVIGESVLNFDAYGTLGLGMLSMQSYDATGEMDADQLVMNLENKGSSVVLSPNVGIGFNFFLNQTVALKIDARSYFYIADEPDYGDGAEAQQLYSNLVASVGLSFFVPEMKKRMYNF